MEDHLIAIAKLIVSMNQAFYFRTTTVNIKRGTVKRLRLGASVAGLSESHAGRVPVDDETIRRIAGARVLLPGPPPWRPGVPLLP
jgi:hypothetical protein